VPTEFRDEKLLEWWARFELARENWADLVLIIDSMPPTLKQDDRWRYWDARARLQVGDQDYPDSLLRDLALEANYYGFLAADVMGLPYSICPQQPEVAPADVEKLRNLPGFSRALELRRLGIRNWSRSEWQMATRELDIEGLRAAAALAIGEDWPEMAIMALGNSGDLRWYDWRFPTEYSSLVGTYAAATRLDPSWVMGLMRSESAMAVDARSSVGALGLMQLMPDTAKQVAKRHRVPYTGKQSLLLPAENIQLGMLYLGEMLERFEGNPVLATGAYNAGPRAVERFLKDRSTNDPAVWIETLPYFETRDYIPRVLAFSTLYDWRTQPSVRRISERMPALNSGKLGGTSQKSETAEVVCQASG
jgi:soluble lytic murein transglycosylase